MNEALHAIHLSHSRCKLNTVQQSFITAHKMYKPGFFKLAIDPEVVIFRHQSLKLDS